MHMMKMLLVICLVIPLSVPATAAELVAPTVPASGVERMPRNADSFEQGLLELLQDGIGLLQPGMEEAMQISSGILVSAILFSLMTILSEKTTAAVSVAGAAIIAAQIYRPANAMIAYASEAVWEICEYGKLLCPVMTTALAAQGGIAAAAALYTGTTAFITLLSMLISRLFLPMIQFILVFSVSYCAFGEEVLKQLAGSVKNMLSWLLKTMLIIFTTYMSISGVVSGTTDAAALKAAKVTISSVVPVVGGILSDASESVLVSMAVMKNAAGVYGILAVLAVFLGPFIKVGLQYLLLKMTAAICGIWGNKRISAMVAEFAAAMGLLLAMVATSCLLVLISTICFMKGTT